MRYCVFLLLLLLTVGCKEQEEKPPGPIRPVKAIQVTDVTFIGGRTFPGITRAESRVNLSFRVDGPLVERPVNVGDRVKKGDFLARIDPRDYEVRLRNAQARLERSQANLTFAVSDFMRAIRIQKEDPGAISERLVDQKREDRNRYLAEVKSLMAEVDAAKDSLSYTYLKAPYRGTIVATYVENYEHVRAKQPIVRMLDISRIEMIVGVPDNLIIYVPFVQEVTVTIDTFPSREFPAKVKEIGTEASLTTRTYPVTLIMDQPDDIDILSGMAGSARLAKADLPEGMERGVEVPYSALFSPEEEKKSYVWIIQEETMTVARREVTKGTFTETGIMITEGISPGEWVVTGGVHYLREGQTVRFMPEEIESFD